MSLARKGLKQWRACCFYLFQSQFYAYCLIPVWFSKDLSFPLLCHGFLKDSTTPTTESLDAKSSIYTYLRLFGEKRFLLIANGFSCLKAVLRG